MDDSYQDAWRAARDFRAALVIGHPGHELLIHKWLEVARPMVFVLTDGSGRANQSRLASTTKILNQTGARCGNIYGRFTDTAAYAAMLNDDSQLFIELARELCEAFITEQIECVAGDAFEGYNPMHDVCRLVINAAVTAARRQTGNRIACFEFSSQPGCRNQLPQENATRHRLDDSAFARKIAAAKGYTELAGEVQTAVQQTPADQLRVECLWPVDPGAVVYRCNEPFYEQYGEQQVAAGYYDQVLRYRKHIAPLAAALKHYAENGNV